MPRRDMQNLCCKGLGYCCIWAALEANKRVRSSLLALKLGVSKRAVNYRREEMRAGKLKCEDKPKTRNYTECLKEVL